MRFNQALADMDAEQFVKSVLVNSLAASDVVVGEDFHYGNGRKGNVGSLGRAGEKFGFGLSTVPMVEIDGKQKFACGTEPEDGMNVTVSRDDLNDLRKQRMVEYELREPGSSSGGCCC